MEASILPNNITSRRRSQTRPLGSGVSARITADTSALVSLTTAFGALQRKIAGVRSEVSGLTKDAQQAQSAMQGVAGGGRALNVPGRAAGSFVSGGSTPRPPTFTNSSQPAGTSGGGGGGMLGGLGFGGGGWRGAALGAGAALAGGALVGGAVRTLDARVDRGMEYASSADRLNVLTQQMYGLSQQQAMAMRTPYTNYKLGTGADINAALQFQTRTGYNLQGAARGIEGIRAMSGWTLSTQDIIAQQEALMQPQVANALFQNMGISPFKLGGGMRDPMEFRNDMITRLGLNDPRRLQGAFQPGSIMRSNMTLAGVPVELQDQLLQQAKMQQTYKSKGGIGTYTGTEAQRQFMGIEGNFATEQEETQRLRTAREEQFMDRQIDNYAKLERNTQTMVELLGSIEDKLSGLIGARTGIRGNPIAKGIGSALQMGGLAAAAFATGPVGIGLGIAAFGAGKMLGDPTGEEGGGSGPVGMRAGNTSAANDDNIHVPVGYGGKRISLTELKSRNDFKRLDTKMQQRLLNMMRENPNVGFGGGWRDTKAQEAMFLQRYRKTDKNTGIFWQGSYWERVTGAPAAPPGRSMHEIGLAADLVGDLDWMNANAARFGLKHFASVNNEPWHVQPAELPNSRREYEKNGGAAGEWGPSPDEAASAGPVTGAPEELMGEHGGHGFTGPRSYSGMSIQDRIMQLSADALSTFGSAPTPSRRRASASGGSTTATTYSGSGAELAARAAYDAGFRGEDLFKIVAIAGRESRWNPDARNPNTSDRGMWQINWSAHKDWLMKEFGLKSDADLLDLRTNARAAYRIFQRSGWHGWKASENSAYLGGRPGWDPNGNEMWKTDQFQGPARAATDAIMKSGDPMPMDVPSGRGGTPSRSGNTYVNSSPSITVPVEIHFHNSAGSVAYDVKTIKRDVEAALEESAREFALRNG